MKKNERKNFSRSRTLKRSPTFSHLLLSSVWNAKQKGEAVIPKLTLKLWPRHILCWRDRQSSTQPSVPRAWAEHCAPNAASYVSLCASSLVRAWGRCHCVSNEVFSLWASADGCRALQANRMASHLKMRFSILNTFFTTTCTQTRPHTHIRHTRQHTHTPYTFNTHRHVTTHTHTASRRFLPLLLVRSLAAGVLQAQLPGCEAPPFPLEWESGIEVLTKDMFHPCTPRVFPGHRGGMFSPIFTVSTFGPSSNSSWWLLS